MERSAGFPNIAGRSPKMQARRSTERLSGFRCGGTCLEITLVKPSCIGSLAGRDEITMTLAQLLSTEQILPEMQATGRWEAITEIVDRLVALGKVCKEDRDKVLAALRQREETMSTGIGFGIAIPHASADCVEGVVAGFGRSAKGIEFDSLDNQPVHFIVLFVVPKDQFQTHLRTLAAIAKFLNDRIVREELAAATDADGIMKVFTNRSPK